MCVQDHSSNSSQLRIQALQFLGVALKSTSPAVWQKHVKTMADAVTAAAGERYSMVSAEGLRVCESLVYVMRPDPSKAIPSAQKVQQATWVPPILFKTLSPSNTCSCLGMSSVSSVMNHADYVVPGNDGLYHESTLKHSVLLGNDLLM